MGSRERARRTWQRSGPGLPDFGAGRRFLRFSVQLFRSDRRYEGSLQRPDLVAKAIVPDYAPGNHVAALGLAFGGGTLLSERYRNGAFVGLHGSWNRKPRSGYKVVFVPFADGKPAGAPLDVLTGFVGSEGNAFGRPAGVALDRAGALLVADDVGNIIWRVSPPRATAAN